ncbi:MAG: hypothetical protein EOP10_11670, partial [Proteobacteria bacterium]
MISRKLLRLLTLSSFLPLVSCATPDDVASPLNAESGTAPINDAKLNQSIEGAVESNGNNASANSGNALANNSGSNNLNEEDDGSMDEGDEDFDNESANGNPLANNTGGPAADVEGNLGGFDDDLAAEEFLDDPAPSTANVAASNAVAADAGNEAINAFKNTSSEQNAFASNASGNVSTENLAPNAAPVANAAVAAVPAPAPAPAAPPPTLPAPIAAPVAPIATSGRDVESTPSTLHWVGYRINETMKKLNVEIITVGRPEYEIFETTNRSNQSELVLRFYHTQLRKKIKWDVNSSEFRSPVAYIRMKNREAEGVVDLVITHRDKVSPGFYEKAGNFILSYDLPQRYFNELDLAKGKVKDKAVSLKTDQSAPLAKAKAVASKLPVVGVPRYMTAIREEPKFRPIRSFIAPKRIRNAKDGFPESFDKTPIRGRRTGEILSRSTLFGVAQDNLENNFENENVEENSANTNVNNNSGNNFNNNSGNNTGNNFNNNVGNNLNSGNASSNANNNSNNGSNLENTLDENSVEGGFNDEASPDAFSNLENKSAAPLNDSAMPASNSANAPASNALPAVTPGEDVEPEEAGGKTAKYIGKPIFMEFYDSPLSLVLKGFSEETGNNFVYSSEIGETPITIQFKGVPWDEALKAILETYTLGMVRIGENVVRIDKIQNLTSYMQALEQAKQFETRRLPTKVLVFRLNNGVAKDVTGRVKELLARDIEIDNRIKLSEDERTNSVVIEAPVNVLAKAKAIIERLDLDTPQVEIMSRIVEVRKDDNEFTGVAWGNNVNFDPGRALGFGSLNFPNSLKSNFSVDPGVGATNAAGAGTIRLGSLNKFLDLDLFLKLEEKKGKTNVLQSNRVLVLDGRKATVTAGSSQFFR